MLEIFEAIECCCCCLECLLDLSIIQVTKRQKPTPTRQERLAKAKARRRNRAIRRYLRKRKHRPDLPVPDLGLICEKCCYRLVGLTEYRCPACGTPFDLRRYIDFKADRFRRHK